MKEHRSNKFYSSLFSLLGLLIIFSSVSAQEYDDMYFNKTDRKKIKTENNKVNAQQIKSAEDIDYSQATQSTELYSAKNVNPEYIARYKATETNEVPEVKSKDEYSSGDYFIEDYESDNPDVGSHMNQIDYAALNKRDQMSYSNYNRNYSNPYWSRPSWGFYPYMSMGYGFGSPFMYDPFMYDPFMMGGFGYGPMMSMGIGYGFGTGFYPSMSYSLAMSWGTGYNPWGGWGAYPYSPYSMRGFYDPWGWSPYRYSPYYGFGNYYGYSTIYATNSNYYENGRNIQYKPRRTSRSATSNRIIRNSNESTRVSSADSRIRVPNRTVSNTSNGRISRDYSKTQNEIYRSSRSNSASQRISTSRANRSSFSRSSSSSGYNSSSISTNRPSRLNNSSSSFDRSGSRSSYSGYNRSGNSSSYSTPSRSGSSSSSFNRSNSYSGSRSSSFSSGSRSSGSSSGSRSSGGSSRSGGRQ